MFAPRATRLSAALPVILFLLCAISVSVSAQNQQGQDVSVEYSSDGVFRSAILNVTNTYRKQHNATGLVWNNTLADTAREWSERCVFEHSGGPYGENLASGYPNASASMIAWGHERVDYDFSAGEFSKETGHFTQLVWKETTSVGCGRTKCDGKDDGGAPGTYVVCTYYPQGNVLGAFVENVQPRVPEDQQPDGPSDPQVPDQEEEEEEEKEECPQGAVCGAAGKRIGGNVGALWVAVLVTVVVVGMG